MSLNWLMNWWTGWPAVGVLSPNRPWTHDQSSTSKRQHLLPDLFIFLSLEYDCTSRNNITWAASEQHWRHYKPWARIATYDLFPSSNGIRRFNPIFVATWGSFCKTWSRFMKWASSEGLEVPEALWNSQRCTHSASPARREGPEKTGQWSSLLS